MECPIRTMERKSSTPTCYSDGLCLPPVFIELEAAAFREERFPKISPLAASRMCTSRRQSVAWGVTKVTDLAIIKFLGIRKVPCK